MTPSGYGPDFALQVKSATLSDESERWKWPHFPNSLFCNERRLACFSPELRSACLPISCEFFAHFDFGFGQALDHHRDDRRQSDPSGRYISTSKSLDIESISRCEYKSPTLPITNTT